MYGYMSTNEYMRLIRDHRNTIVIPNVQTKDLDEYICNIYSYLSNNGINTSIFNIPKIKMRNKDEYTVYLVLRHNMNKNKESEFFKAIQLLKSLVVNVYNLCPSRG